MFQQELRPHADRHGALVCARRGPLAHVDALRLPPDMQRGAIEAQRSGQADVVVQIPRYLEVELHQAVAGYQLEARVVVREVGENDVQVVADARELPVPLPLVGAQRDSRADQIPGGVSQQPLDLRRGFQVGKGVREGAAGAGDGRAIEALGR